MHTLLKALSDLGRDLKIRGKTQALHSLCEDCADPTEFSAHINSCTCQQRNMTQATVSWSHLSLVPPAQWCLWHSLICNWLGSSCAFFCHRISWSYSLWSAESRRVIVPDVRCTSACYFSLPSHKQSHEKKRIIQLWASFVNFKQKTILEAEASIVLNNCIVNLHIIQTLNN